MGERIEVLMVAAGASSVSRAVGKGFGDALRVSVAQDREARAIARFDARSVERARSRAATVALMDIMDL